MAGSGLIGPAFAQTPAPVTLSLFDPDLADIGPAAAEKLKTATNCYPRATFKVGVPSGDPLMQDSLQKAREEELSFTFPRLGLDRARFKVEAGAIGSDDVQVSYDNSPADDDKDAPKLKVVSAPKKGTKVKAGDKIEVTITASEQYQDGHKSWPTGVRSIQLLADDGSATIKVDDKDFGMKPPPCERRTVVMKPYTVPSNLPPIVRLHAIAEDAVGNHDGEDADFPTGDWYGTLKAHGQGNVYNEDATVDFSFSVAGDGTVTGRGRARMKNAPQTLGACVQTHTQTPSEFDFPLAGSRVGGEFLLVIPIDLRSAMVFTASCPTSSSTSPPVQAQAFSGVSSEGFFHPRVRSEDGATNTFHSNTGSVDVTGSIVIHSAKN